MCGREPHGLTSRSTWAASIPLSHRSPNRQRGGPPCDGRCRGLTAIHCMHGPDVSGMSPATDETSSSVEHSHTTAGTIYLGRVSVSSRSFLLTSTPANRRGFENRGGALN